jgi:hypothetical protein
MQTEPFTFRVSADLRQAAEEHAENRGVSLSEDIRIALKEYYHLLPVFALVACYMVLDNLVDVLTDLLIVD